MLLLVISGVPDSVVSVPEGSKSQFIEESVFEHGIWELGESPYPEDYFVSKIAFVILRESWAQEITRANGQNQQNEIDNTLSDANNHLRNALETVTQRIQSKTDVQYSVNNILIGASPLGDFSDIYESIDDTDTIMKANSEIEKALLVLQNSAPFSIQTNENKPYKFEANIIAMQAAQYFKYENDPHLVKYFLDWESNFHIDYNSYVIRKSIGNGKGEGFNIKVDCSYPRTKTVTYRNIFTGEKHDEEVKYYCYSFVSRLGRLDPLFIGVDGTITRDPYSSGDSYGFSFDQETLFEPVLGELHGQEVKEISQMKKYIESKQRDEIPTIRQRISNMRKKLAVPWQPYTMPEPKMESILDEYSYLQKGGLLGLLSEFNESKIRKSSSGEYIYIDETAKIQAFSKLLKSTPTSDDFEKYYENRLLTIKTDLDELENKYSSDSFVTLLKIMKFYNL